MSIPDLRHLRGKIIRDEDLHQFLEFFDREHGDRYGDILFRSAAAYTSLTGEKSVPITDPGYTGIYDPFSGHSLYKKMIDWYGLIYGSLSHLKHIFGVRNIIVRGNTLKLHIPSIYNGNPKGLDPFIYLPDLPQSLRKLLSQDEIEDIRNRFDAFYYIGSRLALCVTILRRKPDLGLVSQFALRGKSDLESATASFDHRDPNPALWSATQALEKYLKCYLVAMGKAKGENELKKNFGHNIRDLLHACIQCNSWLKVLEDSGRIIDFEANDRYNPPRHTPKQALDIIDRSYAGCDAIAQLLLEKYNLKVGSR